MYSEKQLRVMQFVVLQTAAVETMSYVDQDIKDAFEVQLQLKYAHKLNSNREGKREAEKAMKNERKDLNSRLKAYHQKNKVMLAYFDELKTPMYDELTNDVLDFIEEKSTELNK